MRNGRQRTAAIATAVAGLFAASCAASAGGDTVPEHTRLELGTGTARFAEIADGAELVMIKGAQGGWHVWVSVRAEGVDVELASLEIEHQPADESEEPVVTRTGVVFDPPDAEGRRSALGWAAIFTDPACAVGRLHRIHVALVTARGQRLETEREIVPMPGDFPPPACVPPP